MLDEKEKIELSDLLRYLDGIPKERLDRLRISGELSRTTFYTKNGEILSQRAIKMYLENVKYYIDKKFGLIGNSLLKNQLYNNDIISVPTGLIEWINDLTKIQETNNELRKKIISENNNIVIASLFFTLSVVLGLEFYGSYKEGSITLFDLLGRIIICFMIIATVFKLIMFLYGIKERKKNFGSIKKGRIENKTSSDQTRLNPPIEMSIEHELRRIIHKK